MNPPDNYQAALQGAVYYPITSADVLCLSGPDRRAFVQRQTTNNINLLGTGQAQTTVLTSPTGRILDVFLLYPEGTGDEETLVLMPLPGRTEGIFRFLKSRIFFMDKVTLTNTSTDYAHYLLDGPLVAVALEKIGLETVPANDSVTFAQMSGHPLTLIGQPGLAGLGFRIVIPQAAASILKNIFMEADIPRLSADSYELLRIEAGLPTADHELRENYTPLEAGLGTYVAENKGCYTGQEVLARQVNYDKITRQLTGLRLEAPIAPGSDVFVEGRSVGEVTSAVVSPRFGSIALAIIKRPFFEPNTDLFAGDSKNPIPATTCTLPFSLE